MTRKWFSLVLAVQLLALCVVQVALAQDDMKDIKDPAFVVHRRAPAAFAHDAHNEKAKIEDCVVCHHGGKDGVIDKTTSTEGTPCSECHPVVATKAGVTPLQRAWHRQCMDCHRKSGKGPLACGDCHTPAK